MYAINRCANCQTLTTGIEACHKCGGATQIEPLSESTVKLTRICVEKVTCNTLLPSNATQSEIRALLMHIMSENGFIDGEYLVNGDSESWQVDSVISSEYLRPIETLDQAKAFLERLHQDGNVYHLDDSPFEVFSADLAPLIDSRVTEIYEGKFDWAEFDCPMGYCLFMQFRDTRKEWDVAGTRGYTYLDVNHSADPYESLFIENWGNDGFYLRLGNCEYTGDLATLEVKLWKWHSENS